MAGDMFPTSLRRGLYVLVCFRVFQSLLCGHVTVVRVRFYGRVIQKFARWKTNPDAPHPNDYSYASERLRFVIRASGFYTELFARQIGMPVAELLYLVLFDNRPLTPLLVERICARFPQIDARWLLTGRVGE